ncbi:MAG: outer membrane beta-barrel protein [Candidatus Omnitrophica bacterium]|nr:outer membrane beta-barrel protein [Candidatus Omnitrophota bacterium]
MTKSINRVIGGGGINKLVLFFSFLLVSSPPFVFAQLNPAQYQFISPQSTKEQAIQQALYEQEVLAAFQKVEAMQMAGVIPSGAQERFPPLVSLIHPYAGWDVVYDDNIYLTDSNRKTDLINILRPGVKLIFGDIQATKGMNRIELDAGANLFSFYSRDGNNRQEPYGYFFSQFGKGRHKLTLNQSFAKNHSPVSAITIGGSGKFINYKDSTTKFFWESNYNRVGVEIFCTRVYDEYEKEYKAGSTIEQQMYAPNIFFQPSPKTKFFVGYNYGWADYVKNTNKTNNNHYERYWVGAKGELTNKIAGIIKAGIENRIYKGLSSQLNVISAAMDLTYSHSPKTAFTLKLSQGNKDSSYVNSVLDKGQDASVHAIYKFSRTLSLNLGTDFSRDKYDQSGTKSYSYNYITRFDYSYQKWLKMYLSYRYRNKDSNSPSDEYTDNIYSFGAAVIF